MWLYNLSPRHISLTSSRRQVMFPLFCCALDPVANTTFVFCSEYCSQTSQAGIQLPVPDFVCVFPSIFPSFFCGLPAAGQGLRQPGNLLPLQKLPDLEFQDLFFPIQQIRFDRLILPAARQGLRQSGIPLPVRKLHIRKCLRRPARCPVGHGEVSQVCCGFPVRMHGISSFQAP